jgi:hypothetical protein
MTMHAQGGDVVRVECADVGVCTRLAGVGKGEMPTEATT